MPYTPAVIGSILRRGDVAGRGLDIVEGALRIRSELIGHDTTPACLHPAILHVLRVDQDAGLEVTVFIPEKPPAVIYEEPFDPPRFRIAGHSGDHNGMVRSIG